MEYESCMQFVSVLSHLLLLLFPFYFQPVRILAASTSVQKWSVFSNLFIFYYLLFYFSVCCWFCILVSGNKQKKTACRTEVVELKWPRGTAMGVWTAFIVTTSWRTVNFIFFSKIWSLFHWPPPCFFFFACSSNKFSPSFLWLTTPTPMKESVRQTRVLVWNMVHRSNVTGFRFLVYCMPSASCNVCMRSDRGSCYRSWDVYHFAILPFLEQGDPADSLPAF